jgi:phosphoribosylglycinamide formyltransferase 1
MIRLGVLGSTRGTHLTTLVNAIQEQALLASIEIVISNKADALILEKAASYGLRANFIDPQAKSREQYDQCVSDLLHKHEIDLIVLIGYMRILSSQFISEWRNKVINVHPSLLPAHAGKMDVEVHSSVLAAGDNETGCTVHYVTEVVDAGPIILQKRCLVAATDTPESLKARVQQLEGEALVEAIKKAAAHSALRDGCCETFSSEGAL